MDTFHTKTKLSVRSVVAHVCRLTKLSPGNHKGQLLILTYHRVLPITAMHKARIQPGMYVLDHIFEMQMRFLMKHYRVVSFNEVIEGWKTGKLGKDGQYCVITFDDGWFDNYKYAYPILKKYAIPATIFLVTDYVGTYRWFWPDKLWHLLSHYLRRGRKEEHAWLKTLNECLARRQVPIEKQKMGTGEWIEEIIEKCKLLTEAEISAVIQSLQESVNIEIPEERLLLNWEEVEEMSRNGISFGSHSHTHRILTTLPLHQVNDELAISHEVLREKGINYVPIFCYPNGDYTEDIQRVVRQCGYEGAVGTRTGYERIKPEDVFALRRIGVHNDIASTEGLFSLRISGLLGGGQEP